MSDEIIARPAKVPGGGQGKLKHIHFRHPHEQKDKNKQEENIRKYGTSQAKLEVTTMKNKKRSGGMWLQTWRSLLLVSYLSPILYIVFNFHFKSEFHTSSITTHHWLYRGLLVTNVGLLLTVINYFFNYRYLVREKIIEHTKTRFFLGLLPLILCVIINILILIYV